ncbi:hypothetical protein BN903_46 [Halorubrum sp. AJ67]|nr:hypothetical protein BN903_46 [Halorubrum sp. AJ67]
MLNQQRNDFTNQEGNNDGLDNHPETSFKTVIHTWHIVRTILMY